MSRLRCDCGKALGTLEGANWVQYSRPLLCSSCGADHTERVLPHIHRLGATGIGSSVSNTDDGCGHQLRGLLE